VSVFVKICGMTDSRAITAAVEAGADAVGFVFHDASPRNLSLGEARGLAALVPPGTLRVAVMLHPDPVVCRAVLDGLRPDALQTDAGDFAHIDMPEGIAAWPVYRESEAVDVHALPQRYVYEGAQSGQGQQVDWQRAAAVARYGNMMLAGGLAADNVGDALRIVRPWAVDVSSAVESAPGEKDPAKVSEFVRAAKAA